MMISLSYLPASCYWNKKQHVLFPGFEKFGPPMPKLSQVRDHRLCDLKKWGPSSPDMAGIQQGVHHHEWGDGMAMIGKAPDQSTYVCLYVMSCTVLQYQVMQYNLCHDLLSYVTYTHNTYVIIYIHIISWSTCNMQLPKLHVVTHSGFVLHPNLWVCLKSWNLQML